MTKKRTRGLLAGAATAVAGGLYLIAQADVTPQGNDFRVDPAAGRGLGSQHSVVRNPDGSFVVVRHTQYGDEGDVTATDSLAVLKFSVGLPVPLNCPPPR